MMSRWLQYAWIPLSMVVGILGWVLFQSRTRLPNPVTEKRAIDAAADAQHLMVQLGAARTLVRIEQSYAEELEALGEHERRQAESLRSRPDKLAAFLIRAAR